MSEFQQKAPNYYSLDVIISIGYRVKSRQGTKFRQWATNGRFTKENQIYMQMSS
ncbi:MAG: virulence RhuM family protein [Candidatus Fermentibacteraceae bacterium]|nr:virulence RhuM family protein [Candidatus Fermentibacteraceae bacterium]